MHRSLILKKSEDKEITIPKSNENFNYLLHNNNSSSNIGSGS